MDFSIKLSIQKNHSYHSPIDLTKPACYGQNPIAIDLTKPDF